MAPCKLQAVLFAVGMLPSVTLGTSCKVTRATDVSFAPDEIGLVAASRQRLSELAARLAPVELEVVVIATYVPPSGPSRLKVEGAARVNAVKRYLEVSGLPANKLAVFVEAAKSDSPQPLGFVEIDAIGVDRECLKNPPLRP